MYSVSIPLEGFNSSGGLRIITQIANYLSDKGLSVEIIVPNYSSFNYYGINSEVKIRIINTPDGLMSKLYYFLFLMFKSVSKSNDIVIATGFRTPFYIFFSTIVNFSRAKTLYIIQHYEISSQIKFQNKSTFFPYFLNLYLAKIGYNLPSTKIAVSNWIKNKLNSPSINVIPNGIDLNVFKINNLINNRNCLSIGVVGSNKVIKGYQVIVDAIIKLDDSLKSKLVLNIMSNDKIYLPDGIKCNLYVPKNDLEIADFYNQCNIFIFGSYEEGFGLPPLEAMACGCAVISSDCGGVRTFLDEECSLLFEPGNSNDLLDKLHIFLTNSFELENCRQNGIEKVKNFSIEQMLKSYLNIIYSMNL
jgi:glycosyltransferase involved in cell wall biosynthesis